MIAWILYALMVSLLLGLAALSFEASAALRRKGARWLWVAGIVASLALPFAISSITVQFPNLTQAAPPPAGQAVALRQMTESALSPARWIEAAGPDTVALAPSTSNMLAGLWAISSVLMLAGLSFSGLRLQRLKRGWRTERIAGQPVLVGDDVGPAVVGLFDPRIVVPGWLFDLSPAEQELVIAHEQSHLEANDSVLLLTAVILVICMPWNLPLWWQLRRLRRAIEVDCDARVLRRGHSVASYGRALLTVGERHSRRIAVVAAMTESKSFLTQRITAMLRKKAKFAWVPALAFALLGLMLAAGAAEVTPPNSDQPGHHEISVDPKILRGYVGKYKLSDSIVASVMLDGPHLSTQLTGQGPVPIFPESDTVFFAKMVNAQFTFVPDAGGVARTMVLHQNGADIPMPRIDEASARMITDLVAARFAGQKAAPGSEAALRHLVEGLMSGQPDYDRMAPALADATRAQLPNLSKMVENGPITAIRFLGVSKDGWDVYSVFQEKGASHWRITVDDKGIVTGAWEQPGP